MEITEKDIFNFVFYTNLLPPKKIKYIEGSTNFSKGIKFYQSLKLLLSQNLTVEIKNLISEKIPVYKSMMHKLYLVKEVNSKRKSNLILVADSPKIKSKMTSATFIDDEKQYLIKLHNYENSAKIYVFSTSKEKIENYKIIIHPSNNILEQADNSNPIIIDAPVEVSSMELQFN